MTLLLTAPLRRAILRHVYAELPREAVALLAGPSPDRPLCIIPMRNTSPDPTRFFAVDEAQVLAAFEGAERSGWPVCGLLHSHPTGPPEPSRMDIAAARDPALHYVVVSGLSSGVVDLPVIPVIRSWRRLVDTELTEEAVHHEPDRQRHLRRHLVGDAGTCGDHVDDRDHRGSGGFAGAAGADDPPGQARPTPP